MQMGNQYCIELSETVLDQEVAPVKNQCQLQSLAPDDTRASQRYGHLAPRAGGLAYGPGQLLSLYTLRVIDGSGNSSIIGDRGFSLHGYAGRTQPRRQIVVESSPPSTDVFSNE